MARVSLTEIFDSQERLLCAYLNLLKGFDLKTDPQVVEPQQIQDYFNVLYNYITSDKHNGIHLKVLNLLKKNILFDLIDLALGTASKSVTHLKDNDLFYFT